jgi:hypothetical protein
MISPLFAADGQSALAQSSPGKLQTGRYEGNALNTTAAVPVHGHVVFIINDFDSLSSKVKVAMVFSTDLCGKGESSGSLERNVIQLFGRLSSLDETCGDQSWNMVTRCTVSGNHRLACEYWLQARPGYSFSDQKGKFDVDRVSEIAPRITDQGSAARAIATDPAYFSDKDDRGVDLALVTTNRANVRAGPGTTYTVSLQVEKGEGLVLVDRQPTGQWYNVIHIGSGSEGWVHASVIKLVYTRKRSSGPVFSAERIDAYSAPVIEVSNQSNKNLNLKVGSTIHNISPYSKKTITLSAGEYRYYGSASGVMPAIGEHSFEIGYKYTWTFWIETRVR